MATTKIEWADRVWNPTTGCTKVSEGCRNCYAQRIAKRFWGARKFSDVRCHPERLEEPSHWRKPSRIFVDSMSDLFHPAVPDEFIDQVFYKMMQNTRHNFLILTKRPERMFEFCSARSCAGDLLQEIGYCLPAWNVWLGVSVEDQKTADERIPWLIKTVEDKRFVSFEPALGEVALTSYLDNLDWVIMGCESGPGARPMQPDWVRSMRDQCVAAGVPFFLKQMMVDGELVKMPVFDGVVWAEFPKGLGCREEHVL